MSNREIEYKYKLKGLSYECACQIIEANMTGFIGKKVEGSGRDWFWAKDGGFIRLRCYDENTTPKGQLTYKKTDKDDIVDRLEININLVGESDIEATKTLMNTLYGKFNKTVWKRYIVLYTSETNNVTVYETDDKDLPVFLEIEADSVEALDKIAQLLPPWLVSDQCFESLYQMVGE